jgi:uncharacterized protein YbbK (DUF523 family)
MGKIEPQKPRLGISACLLGEPVRWDGGHKGERFLVEHVGPLVEWVPVCPEVELGLGVPRPPIRLIGAPRAPRLVVEGTGEDLTARMTGYAEDRVAALSRLGLDGYVLKSRSPSCGLRGVPIDGRSGRGGRGLFAAALGRRLPGRPIEEESRLADPFVRQRFLARAFTAARWRHFLISEPDLADLRAFHAAEAGAVRRHSARHARSLARLVATAGRGPVTTSLLGAYGALLMQAMAAAGRGRPARTGNLSGPSRGRRARARRRPRRT